MLMSHRKMMKVITVWTWPSLKDTSKKHSVLDTPNFFKKYVHYLHETPYKTKDRKLDSALSVPSIFATDMSHRIICQLCFNLTSLITEI